MKGKSSLAFRAGLAVLLMVAFYVLALGIAGLLAWLPIWEYLAFHRVHVKLALACIVGAAVIVWSVLPRWDRFPPPGVRLTPEAQPEFFATLREVAAKTGQAMPKETYLVGDVNAFVAQRGGVMGFLSRRVLGVGLPLLRAMNVDQVRAVLAHEFGHFHGGDTKLGPWIYKTRAAIGRTVQALSEVNSLVSYPFRWYGALYLRITQAISRAQEFAADRLAASVVGRVPLTSGLEALPATSLLFDRYWHTEFTPILGRGKRPPLADGFLAFLQAEPMKQIGQQVKQDALEQKRADPYDTHPPIAARVEAVAVLPEHAPGPRDDRPAICLLRNVDALELALLEFAASDKAFVKQLQRIEWDQTGAAVVVEIWRECVESLRKQPGHPLEGAVLAQVPDLAARLEPIGKSLLESGAAPEQAVPQGTYVVEATLGLALVGAGFRVVNSPGEPLKLLRGDLEIRPAEWIHDLAKGTVGAAAWTELCERNGLGALALVP